SGDDKTAWFDIVRQLKTLFVALVEILPGMSNVITNIETPIDNHTSIETYNKLQEVLKLKFPAGYWYKDWRYLYCVYQAFVEWSAIQIHKDLINKGELLIISDLWRFGEREWTTDLV